MAKKVGSHSRGARPVAPKKKTAESPNEASASAVTVTSVFVIMPFTSTLTRNSAQLTAFFNDHLKLPIENEVFTRMHRVNRSENAFNINAQIIKDLYAADIVICDLSGTHANPNVMYELGIRLSVSSKPVILIREAHKDNAPIFDIGGFFAEPYDPYNYAKLTAHVISKLHKFESGEEAYESPVLSILEQDQPLMRVISANRAAYLLIVMISSLYGAVRLFGGALHKFFTDNGAKFEIGGSVEEILKTLYAHREELPAFDWSLFRFRPGGQPAIDAYIANLYLSGLVDPSMEIEFTSAIVEYHSYFLSGDFMFGNVNAVVAYRYLGETLLLADLGQSLHAFLRANSQADRDRAREQFAKDLAQRQI